MELIGLETFEQIQKRWGKVDNAISVAQECEDEQTQAVICESILVLISANLEGGTRDLIKSFIEDVNDNFNFEQVNSSIKRQFVKSFLPDENDAQGALKKDLQQRIQSLLDFFSKNKVKLSPEPFYKDHTNPKPDTFTKIFKNIGEKKFFDKINQSPYADVFGLEYESVMEDVMQRISMLFKSDDLLEIFVPITEETRSPKLWEEFLNQLVMERNKIAHGSGEQGTIHLKKVIEYKWKASIFQYLSILVMYDNLIDMKCKLSDIPQSPN